MKKTTILRIFKKFSGLMLLALLFTVTVSATVNAAGFYFDSANVDCDYFAQPYDLWSDVDCWDDSGGSKWNSIPGSADDVYIGTGDGDIIMDVAATVRYLELQSGYTGTVTTNSVAYSVTGASAEMKVMGGTFDAALATSFTVNGNFTNAAITTFGSAVTFGGNVDAIGGDLDLTNLTPLTIAGTLNIGGGGTPLTLTSSQVVNLGGLVVVNGSSLILPTSSTFNITNDLTVAGVLNARNATLVDINGNLEVTATGDLKMPTTLKLAGNFTIDTSATFSNENALLELDGNTNGVMNTMFTSRTLASVKISKDIGKSFQIIQGTTVISGTLSVNAGTVSMDTITVGALAVQGGTVSLTTDSGLTVTGNAIMSSGVINVGSSNVGAVVVSGTYQQSGGTFNNYGINVTTGAFTLSSGTFNAPNSPYQLSVSSLTVSGTGDFNGGSADVTVAGNCNITSSTAFQSTSGSLLVGENLNIGLGATFNNNSGKVVMNNTDSSNPTLYFTGSGTFNDFEINFTGAGVGYGVLLSGEITVDGQYKQTSGGISDNVIDGVVNSTGDLIMGSDAAGGTATINVIGTAANVGYFRGTVPELIINNPNFEGIEIGSTIYSGDVTLTQGVLKTYFYADGFFATSLMYPIVVNTVFTGAVNVNGGTLDEDVTGEASGVDGSTTTMSTFLLSSGLVDGGLDTLTLQGSYTQTNGTFNGNTGDINFATINLGGGSLNLSTGTTILSSVFTQTGGTFTGSTGSIAYGSTFNQTAGTHNDGNGARTYADAMYLKGGTYIAGANAKSIPANLEISYASPYTADVDMSNTLSLSIIGALNMGNAASAVGDFTLPSGLTSIQGNITKVANSSNLSFNHGNGEVYLHGSSNSILSGDSLTFYDFTINKIAANTVTVDLTTVEGRLYFMDGACSGSTIYASGDFQYDAAANGGSCIIEFNSASAQTFDIDGGVTVFPKFNLNSASTTINLSSSNTNTITFAGRVDINAGTFNQNTTSINTGSGYFYLEGGDFNTGVGPHTGDITTGRTYLGSGNFNAPSGSISFERFYSSYSGAKDAVVDLSASNSVSLGYQAFLGTSGSTGSVKASPGTMTTGVVFSGGGSTTFDANGGKVQFTSINHLTVGSFTFYDLDVSTSNSYYIYYGNNTKVEGTLTQGDGKCLSGTVEIQGDLVFTDTYVGYNNSCQFLFNSTTPDKTIVLDTNYSYPIINLDSATTTMSFSGTDLDVTGYFILTDGVINQGTTNITVDHNTVNGNGFRQVGGTFNGGSGDFITVAGGNRGILLAGGTFNAGSGTYTAPYRLEVNYNSSYGGTAVADFSNANLDIGGFGLGKTGSTGSFTAPGAGKSFTVNGFFLNSTGNTIFDANGGTVTMDGAYSHTGAFSLASPNELNNLVIDKDNITAATGMSSLMTINNIIIKQGKLYGNSGTLTVNGDWTLCPSVNGDPGDTSCSSKTVGDAEYVGGTKTVVFAGTDQHINGSNDHTFYNFTKIATEEDTLTFEAGEHQIITNTTTLKGVSAIEPLHLVSSNPGTQWYFDPQGTRNFQFLTTTDSNNENAVKIATVGLDIVDAGNNWWWDFPFAPVVSNLGPFVYTNGSATQNTQPTITFDVDELNDQDIYYKIIINDADDINTPIIEYTSETMSDPDGGTVSFTVGQTAAVGAAYQAGAASQTLSDGNYYWRVYASNGSLTSEWARANGGEIAFIVDTVGPDAVVQVSPNGNTGDSTPVYLWRRITDDGGGYVITVKNSGDVEQYQITGINSGTSFTEAVALLSPGDYSWEIYAIDAAGNPGAVSSMDFTLINMIPEYDAYMYITVLLAGMGLIYWKRKEMFEDMN